MSKTNTLQITDLMFGSFEEHDLKLHNIIKSNPEYMGAVKDLEEHYEELKKINPDLWLEMDSDVNRVEVISRDIAFNEGFKLAVKLILSSIQ